MPDAGWYPDPGGSGGYRRWDGHGWTDDVRVPAPPADTTPPGDPVVEPATDLAADHLPRTEQAELSGGATRPVGVWLVASGGVFVILGSILPWVSVSAPLAGSSTRSGTDGDGVFTLLAGIAVLAAMWFSKARGSADKGVLWLALGIIGLGVLCLIGYDVAYIHHRFGLITRAHAHWSTSYGVGLFVVVLGGLAIGAGSVERALRLRRPG